MPFLTGVIALVSELLACGNDELKSPHPKDDFEGVRFVRATRPTFLFALYLVCANPEKTNTT